MLTLATLGVKGQSAVPFKGANKIIFECKDSGEDLYVGPGKHLISKGYMTVADKDFLNIRTKTRNISDEFSAYAYAVNSIVENNKMSLPLTLRSGQTILHLAAASVNRNKIFRIS